MKLLSSILGYIQLSHISMADQDIKYLAFLQRGAEGAILFATNGYEYAKRKAVQITPKTVEGMISGTEEHLQPVVQSSLTLSHSVLKLMDTMVSYLGTAPVRHTYIARSRPTFTPY